MTKKLLFLILLLFTVQGLFAFSIYIKMPNGKIITVETESSDSFQQVMQKIKNVTGYPVESQILAYNNEIPLTGRTLADYGVSRDGSLQLIILATPAPTTDNIIFVNQNAPATSNQSGSSWDNAITDLSSALLWTRQQQDAGTSSWTSAKPIKIYIAQGSYYPVYNANDGHFTEPGLRYSAFVLEKNVQLIGGFPGTGNPGLSDRDWTAYPTVLSGDPLTPTDITDNAAHVVIAAGTVDSAMLMGLTVTKGIANYSVMTVNGEFLGASQGGGLININASTTIREVIFKNNQAIGQKGPNGSSGFINGLGGMPGYGGGMYNANANPILINVAFIENQAIGAEGGDGMTGMNGADGTGPADDGSDGGVGGNGGPGANGQGGGLYNLGASPKLINVVFYKNSAVGGKGGEGGNGGSGGNSGNDGEGTGIAGDGGKGGNSGAGGQAMGAGIYSSGSSNPAFINNTLNANQSIGGLSGKEGIGGIGGIAHSNGSNGANGLTGSDGQGFGGGLFSTGGSNTDIQNTIIFDNTAYLNPELGLDGATINIGYSYIKGSGSWDVSWGTDVGHNIVSVNNPFSNAAAHDLTLTSKSSAINAGNNSSMPTTVTTDIAGNERLYDGTIDMGAYEFVDNAVPVQLLYFRANMEQKIVHLVWETAAELNNDHFIVYRSSNGIDYKQLAEITGHGTTSQPHTYSMDDIHPYNGLNYYQLQQVNTNGRISSLKTVTIDALSDAKGHAVYPNPARNLIHIQLKEKGHINLYDPSGKKVKELNGKAGDNQVNITGLPSGIYFIQIQGAATPLKFIKR